MCELLHVTLTRENGASDEDDPPVASSSQCDTGLQQLQTTTSGISADSGVHVPEWDGDLGAWKKVTSGDELCGLKEKIQDLTIVKRQKNPTGAAPTTFHKFSDLPFEIREIIWELCLHSRLVQPWYYGLHPVRQLEKYSPIANVSKEAFCAVLRLGCWAEVMVKHMHRVPLVPSASPYLARRIWFHKKDVVYLGIEDCHTLTNLPTISRQTRNSDITRPALDPATRLLISSDLGDRLGWPVNPRYRKGRPLKEKYETTPAGKVLYERFLKTRKSFIVELYRFEVVLEGPAREDAVRAGMFGLWGNEPAIIDADDTTALRKYKALLEKGNGTYVFDSATEADVLYGIDEIKALGRSHDGHDGAFMRRLLRVLGDLVEVKFDWGDVLHENGEVNRDHPMVKKLGFSLPECKSVFVFELLSEEDTKREKDRLFWLYSSDDSDDEESEDERED